MKKLVLLLALVLASVCAHAQVLHVDGAEVTERPQYIMVQISKVPMGSKYFAGIGYGQAISSSKPGAIHTPEGTLLKLESEMAFVQMVASLGYRIVTSNRVVLSSIPTLELLMERK